jgi:transcriptional regulator with XRE-family HTH domain
MAKKQPKQRLSIIDVRTKLGLNQSEFWRRIGVTQSGGSRYENGRTMPTPTAILFELVFMGTDTTAAEALAVLRHPG